MRWQRVKWNTVEQCVLVCEMAVGGGGGMRQFWWWWWFSIQLRIRKFAIFRHVFGIARACFILWEFLFEYYRHGVMPLFLCAQTHTNIQTFAPPKTIFAVRPFAHSHLLLLYCACARTQLLNAFRCFLKQWILVCFNRSWCVCLCVFCVGSRFCRKQHVSICVDQRGALARACVCV